MKTQKRILRYVIYFSGLFIITIGVNLAILSNLGVSPVSAFTVPLSQAIGVGLGSVTAVVYILFVGLQKLLLGKRFRTKDWLQIPFSMVFGFFVDATGYLLSFIAPQNYLQKLLLLFGSIVICSIGVVLYLSMDVVANSPEGLVLAISIRLQVPFGRVKMISDCVFVAIGIVISLCSFGEVTAIREGTILCALCTGKVIQTFLKWFGDKLQQCIQ